MALCKLFAKVESDFSHVQGIHWPTVRHIPLGIEEDSLAESITQESSREILQLPKEVPIILYNGRLSQEYKADLEPLILTLARLQQPFKNVVLCIAGHEQSSDYSRNLGHLASRCGVREKVRFIVNYPRHLKALIYRSADIFVSPVDNYQETFGLSILEAMAAGLPVVASDWSGYRDIIADGATGFLIKTIIDRSAGQFSEATSACCPPPLTEAMFASRTVVDVDMFEARLGTLLRDQNLCRQFGERGKTRVRNTFLWRNIITQFGELWLEQHALSQQISVGAHRLKSFSDLFETYATSYLEEAKCSVSCSLLEFQRFQKLYGTSDVRFPILGTCLQPQSVLSIRQRFGAGSETVVMNLLKKGFLRFVDL